MREFEETRPPFLIIADNSITIDRERTTLGDLLDVLDIFTRTKSLWFRMEYVLFGEQRAIHPREFINARTESDQKREKFINDMAYELLWSENIRIAIINPDQVDTPKNY